MGLYVEMLSVEQWWLESFSPWTVWERNLCCFASKCLSWEKNNQRTVSQLLALLHGSISAERSLNSCSYRIVIDFKTNSNSLLKVLNNGSTCDAVNLNKALYLAVRLVMRWFWHNWSCCCFLSRIPEYAWTHGLWVAAALYKYVCRML